VIVMLFRPAGLWPATAVLPWLKRGRPTPPAFTEATAVPSEFESVDGVPGDEAQEGEQR
jgi:branched-chain amino acid transport system permease protein